MPDQDENKIAFEIAKEIVRGTIEELQGPGKMFADLDVKIEKFARDLAAPILRPCSHIADERDEAMRGLHHEIEQCQPFADIILTTDFGEIDSKDLIEADPATAINLLTKKLEKSDLSDEEKVQIYNNRACAYMWHGYSFPKAWDDLNEAEKLDPEGNLNQIKGNKQHLGRAETKLEEFVRLKSEYQKCIEDR